MVAVLLYCDQYGDGNRITVLYNMHYTGDGGQPYYEPMKLGVQGATGHTPWTSGQNGTVNL